MATTETRTSILKLKLEGDSDLKKRNNEILISMQKNRDEFEKNKKALEDLKKAGDTTSQSVNDLKIKNIELSNSNKALNGELQNNIKVITSELGALNEKRATLANMIAAYGKMGDAEKAHAEAQGKGTTAIRALRDEITKEEMAYGSASRNVGFYTEGIIKANEQMGLNNTIMGKGIQSYKSFKLAALEASGGTSVLNGALKLLQTQPVFAIIAIVAGVFLLLKEAIGKNASIVGEFTRALAPLKEVLGFIFSIVGEVVKILVGGFAKAMDFVTSLFGDAGAAANEYTKALKDAAAAEKELFNLKIREKEEQKVINNLMAVANNRMVDGRARYEAISKAIKMQLDLSKAQAVQSEIIFKGTVANLEAEYNLRGNLMNKDMTLTKEANKKLSQEDKELYRSKLDQRIEFDERESEIRKETGRKLGQIQKAIVASEKEQRDLSIAAMNDGLQKQLATIASNYKAQKQTAEISFKEQRISIKNELEAQLEQYRGNFDMLYKLYSDYYDKRQTLAIQQAEQKRLFDAAEAREKATAAKNAAKSAGDSRLAIERQIQDAYLSTIQDGYYKEQSALLVAYQRKREDIKREAEFTGKNKKETNDLLNAIDSQYRNDSERFEREHQKTLNDLLTGKLLERKTKEIELRLAAVREGSASELALRIQELGLQYDAEIAAAAKLGADVNLVKAKFAKEEFDLRQKYEQDAQQKIADEIKQGYLNQIEIARQNGEDTISLQLEAKQREIDNIKMLEDESYNDFIARKLELEAQLVDISQQGADERLQIQEAEFQIAQAITDGIAALGDIFAEEQGKNARFAKAMALFQLGLDTAKAISSAIAGATGAAYTPPTPASPVLQVLYTVSAIATVLTNIARAKKLLTADPPTRGKALGGLIVGPGSGTSDSVPINASHGESMMTAQSTAMFAPLLSPLNMIGGGVSIDSVNKSSEVMGENFLANAFLKALIQMPAPRVALDEFHRADSRYVSITENAIK